MLHAYAARFDVTENFENFLIFECTKQGLSQSVSQSPPKSVNVIVHIRWNGKALLSTALNSASTNRGVVNHPYVQ